ncbi:speckle targeted PIP5K1A-regulated poly(A) polymerase-like isoform X2 [Argonauta hians]
MNNCETCNMRFPNEAAMKAHKTSEKHQNRSEIFQACLLDAAHCVHVTGFSRSINKESLYNYFIKFGKVTNITYIDQNNSWGPFAFVKFENLTAASAVLRNKQHYLGRHFIRVQPKRIKLKTWQLPYRDPHQSGQQHKGPPIKRGKQIHLLEQINIKDLVESLQKEVLEQNTVDEQILLLHNQVKLTDDELQKREEFCTLFRNVLCPYFPGCSVSLFGSSVNGFGIRGCDIDVFLDLHQTLPKDVPAVDEEPNLKFMKNTAVPMDNFLHLTAYKQVRFLQKILSKHLRDSFGNFFPIPSVQCPIVRFIHRKSNITFDLSLQNKNGLHNTSLLKYYKTYDSRVAPMVCVIRLWAKLQKLASIGGTSFSSYSITLLVIFFLQNTQPAVLPSVKHIIDLCTPEEINIVDGCNYSYPKRPPAEVLPPSENTDNLETLVCKFFDFFLHIDYESTVISTNTAQLLPRSTFETDPDLQTFKLSSISIQDPYMLATNVAGNVIDKVKMDFIKGLFKAQTQLSSPKPEKGLWGIPSIFVVEEPPANGKAKSKKQSSAEPILLNFPINVCRLNKNLAHFAKRFESNQLLWCEVFCIYLKSLLSELLLIECSHTSDVDSSVLGPESSNEGSPSKGGKKKKRKKVKNSSMSESDNSANILQSNDDSKEELKKEEHKENTQENLNKSLSDSSETAMNIKGNEESNVEDLVDEDSNITDKCPGAEQGSSTNIHEGSTMLSDSGTKRKQENSPELVDLLCTVKHYIWFNRKNVRQKLLTQDDTSLFELEKKITHHIVKTENKNSDEKQPITIFRLSVVPDVEYMNLTSVSVQITPVLTASDEKSLKNSHGIYDFLVSFLKRMVSSYFIKWCTTNCTDDFDISVL